MIFKRRSVKPNKPSIKFMFITIAGAQTQLIDTVIISEMLAQYSAKLCVNGCIHKLMRNQLILCGLPNHFSITNSLQSTLYPGTPPVPAGRSIFGILAALNETPEKS